jgi:hypothetical protein
VEEGRRKREEERGKKEEGRGKKEEGRRKKEDIVLIDVICYAKVLLDSRKVLPLQIVWKRK